MAETTEQGAQPQDPTPQTTTADVQPAPAAPEPSQGATGPWAADLERAFEDANTRAQVDSFLRQHTQPHVTRLEQRVAEAKPALELYEDLQAAPGATYLAITEELFGEDAAEAIRGQLEQRFAEPAQPDPSTPATPAVEPQAAPLDPRLEAMLSDYEQRQRAEAYSAELERVKGTALQEDVALDDTLFHPFVVASEGDFDKAYAGYKQWLEQAKAQFGSAQPDPKPEAPPAIGSDATGASAPPTQRQYGSIEEALLDAREDLVRAARAADAPTPVGS